MTIKEIKETSDNYIRGILTNCSTNEKIDIDLEYEIEIANNFLESDAKYFRLIVRLFPPPEDLIGYIGFSIDNANLRQISKKGWMACNCDEDEIEDTSTKITKHYKLFFPPEEMKKVFAKQNFDENSEMNN
jgi:hypothetical protein